MTEIKPWHERGAKGLPKIVIAMQAEIDELRAALAQPAREPMTTEQIDAVPFTGFIPVSERGHSETEALRIFARLVEAHIKGATE